MEGLGTALLGALRRGQAEKACEDKGNCALGYSKASESSGNGACVFTDRSVPERNTSGQAIASRCDPGEGSAARVTRRLAMREAACADLWPWSHNAPVRGEGSSGGCLTRYRLCDATFEEKHDGSFRVCCCIARSARSICSASGLDRRRVVFCGA
jgi:hypothetical protein